MSRIKLVAGQLDIIRKQKLLQANNAAAIKRNRKAFKKRYAEAVPSVSYFDKIFGGMFTR